MKTFAFRVTCGFLLILSSIMVAQAQVKQYTFDGFVRNTEDYTTKTTISGATITIYKEDDTAPSDVTDCSGNAVSSVPSISTGYFCFKGPATRYNIVITSSSLATKKYRWITEDLGAPGVYSLKDFGAKGDGSDETFLIKSAMAFIGSRGEIGGQLSVPNGVFKVRGDTPGTYNQAALPIVLPPGLTLQGTNAKYNFASSRIQLDPDTALNNKTIFKIGNNTDEITIRDLGIIAVLVSAGNGQYTYHTGTTGILAQGSAPNSSQNFVFSNVTLQGFEEGIHVDGTDTDKGWQFDYVKLDNSTIIDCKICIHFDTLNSDWQISNSVIATVPNGVGMQIDKMASLQLQNVFGGGPPASAPINRALSAKAFIWVKGQHSSIDIQNCESENARNAILYDWNNTIFDLYSSPLKIQNSIFGDLISLRANVVYVSVGNTYFADTVRTVRPGATDSEDTNFTGSTATRIYSFGDRFLSRNYEGENCPPLTVGSDIFPTAQNPSVTCKRDFYLDNTNGEANVIVARTSQKRVSTNDSESLEYNLFQSPLKITSPPAYGSNIAWGYSIERSTTDGFLEFKGNQRPPLFSYNASGYRFDSGVYPAADAQYELGNSSKRWSLVRGVTIVSGDTILSDKRTGKELYKIHEDENNIYFQDIRTGKELMKIDRDGNLYVAGRIIQGKQAPSSATNARTTARKRRPRR